MRTPSFIGVLGHPERPATKQVAEAIVRSIRKQGRDAWCESQWNAQSIRERVQQSDMVIAIGGDGAMLRAIRVCAPESVPVLGVKMGRLGFLTEIDSVEAWHERLPALFNGDYWIEERMMIRASILRNGAELVADDAVNDVVLSGSSVGAMIQLDAYIDGDWATTYNCDALIIATPTGSTGYALAAGGPILPPTLSNILIIPTAAHLSMDRSIVLSHGAQVAVHASEENRRPLLLMVDGIHLAQLEQNDIITVEVCSYPSRFVRLRDRNYFYRSLLDRLEPRINRTGHVRLKTLKQLIEDKS